MVLFIILGTVVALTVIVLGILFFMLNKEQKKEEEQAVPVTDLDQLKKDLSSQLFEQSSSKVIEKGSEIIPVFEAKVSMPTQKAESPVYDDAYKKRARELEDELLSISKKADGQSDEARQLIESLTKENQSLKNQQVNLEEARQRLIELQAEAASLKSENVNLQNQLEATNANVQLLEGQMAAFKIQMGDELSRANATVSELAREKEDLLAAPKPGPDQALRQEIEALNSEHMQLKQKYDDLERTHQKLRELNVHLGEKNDLLKYELVKARAQSSGLERVSFNYKNQLEDFLNKIHAVQGTNDQLSQVKNRLEGMVEQVKSQNEELLKKDQLSQFELEKNRSRLVSLEREYEDLKARVQQQNQS